MQKGKKLHENIFKKHEEGRAQLRTKHRAERAACAQPEAPGPAVPQNPTVLTRYLSILFA